MKIFPLVKNFGKILQKVKIFHKVIQIKIKNCLNSTFYENLQGGGGSAQMQNFRPQKFFCLLRIPQ